MKLLCYSQQNMKIAERLRQNKQTNRYSSFRASRTKEPWGGQKQAQGLTKEQYDEDKKTNINKKKFI